MAIATRPKLKPHHRKRQAKHHRRGKAYTKPYWPYLPMLFIAGLGLMINSLWSSASVLGVQSDFSQQVLLEATNQARAAADQSPLTLDTQLTAAAQAKAEDMAARNYWSHTSPDGKSPWSFITAAGYNYQLAGENLAFGFAGAADTVTGWMNSSEHRANILNAAYQNVGFGVADSPDFRDKGPQIVVVAEYAKPAPAVANITFSVPSTAENTPATGVKGDSEELEAKPVSRIQLLTGGRAAWTTLAVGVLVGAGLTLLLTRHGFRLHRTISRGEAFVVHHPVFDIVVVGIVVLGFILTRTSGLIR